MRAFSDIFENLWEMRLREGREYIRRVGEIVRSLGYWLHLTPMLLC
jgi:hypothetical protein